MVKLYFDVRKGDELIPDLEGEEFEDLAQAKNEAEAALRELLGEDIRTAAPLVPRSIIIRDEQGGELAAVELSGAVKMAQETRNP